MVTKSIKCQCNYFLIQCLIVIAREHILWTAKLEV